MSPLTSSPLHPITLLTTALAEQGATADPATGLVYLGNGRFYDPALGRPLQPNPLGGVPILPQSLSRYGATPLGAPGVAEGVSSGGLDFLSSIAWTGVAGNTGLEITGRKTLVEASHLILRGSGPALQRALAGQELPFEVAAAGFRGGRLGELVLGASGYLPWIGQRVQQKLANRLVILEVAIHSHEGLIKKVGQGRFFLTEFETTLDTAGLQVESYQRGLLLGEARALRTLASVGLTAVIDIGFEAYEWGTGTGQWGNPYLTPGQKTLQAITVIGSDLVLAGGLAFAGAAWQVAIPVAFVWALIADPIFSQLPGTSQFYEENRNLQPLQ